VQTAVVGFFGKLPCNGDFIQQRVAPHFVDIWDPWLEDCIHTSRERMQEDWLPSYMRGPLWRFVLSDNVCGAGVFAGVIAPSVDRVGRYFPITIVAQLDIDAIPLDFALRHDAWFEAAESLIVATLDEQQVDLARFDAQVDDLQRFLEQESGTPIDRDVAELMRASAFPGVAPAWRVPLPGASGLQSVINTFAARELNAKFRPLSIWWTDGSPTAEPSWLSLRGLPTPAQFGAMLSGEWAAFGWQDLGTITYPMPAAPQATVPAVQLSAVETNKAAFVSRPEIGFWAAVATTGMSADPTAVRMTSDALQTLTAAPSLTGLVEAIRRVVSEVHQQLRAMATREVQRVSSAANLAVLVVAGAECALLLGGNAQAFRAIGRVLEPVGSTRGNALDEPMGDVDAFLHLKEPDSNAREGESGSAPLGTEAYQQLAVQYEPLQADEQWLLCARAVIGPRQFAQLSATVASGTLLSADLISQALSREAPPGAVIPVMTLTV
jgi:type VI secretion system protein ImpM